MIFVVLPFADVHRLHVVVPHHAITRSKAMFIVSIVYSIRKAIATHVRSTIVPPLTNVQTLVIAVRKTNAEHSVTLSEETNSVNEYGDIESLQSLQSIYIHTFGRFEICHRKRICHQLIRFRILTS